MDFNLILHNFPVIFEVEHMGRKLIVTSLERIDFKYSLIPFIHLDFGTIVEGINKPIQRNIIQLELFIVENVRMRKLDASHREAWWLTQIRATGLKSAQAN